MRLGVLVLLSLLAVAPSVFAAPDSSEGKPLNVLFLGDDGHHEPHSRYTQLAPVFESIGIQLDYTDDIHALNTRKLQRYDALLIYANIEAIEPREERALLDYVHGGGGLVALHCASFCFQNSKAYIELVGGQFDRHGTGDFDTTTVAPDHPIMRGFEPFRTWDETYVHRQHNEQQREVLQTRAEGDGQEPWTWVRTHGKGRVFYTAYGHDARTWSTPGFQALVERGTRWAAGREVADHRPRPSSEPVTFEFAPAKLPNYLAGEQWGVQGEPITKMQKPLSPQASQDRLVLPPGFRAELFVSEPDVTKPVAMAWDHRGRLWVAETVDYPNDLQPAGQGNDRIKICEDTDGDWRADKFTIFAEGLSIPTSLLPVAGGVIVHQAPDTLLLVDTNGDDQADERRVLFSGWNTSDTHAGPSNLRWGFDNWVYGVVGYSGFQGEVGGERHDFRTGFYRFRPDGSKLEFLRNTNNNTWGLGFSEEGHVFASTANANPSVYLPIANRYFEGVRGLSSSVLGGIAQTDKYYPITDKVRQMDWHGNFTAAAGHALYTARNYPKHYWNRAAFVTEPTGHLAATFLIEPRGSDFVSYNAWNLVASDDEWTSPIAADVGPDGNVWVLDWYNFIIQHNPTPEGFENGKGNAYVTPLRDKRHGRVYRIVHESSPTAKSLSLDPNEADQLVEALRHDNLFWRLTAQRLLVERGKKDVTPALVELVNDERVDAIGLAPQAIHALWTLHGLGVTQENDGRQAAVDALRHPSASVRRNAALVLPREDASAEAIVAAGLLRDPDAQVRLAALLALSEMPAADDVGAALAETLFDPTNERDRWIAQAMLPATARHDVSFLAALTERKPTEGSTPNLAAVRGVAEHYARGEAADSVGDLLVRLPDYHPTLRGVILEGLAQGWPEARPAKLDARAEAAIAGLLTNGEAGNPTPLLQLARRVGSKSFETHVEAITRSLRTALEDEEQPVEARLSAANQLIALQPKRADSAEALLDLVGPRTAPELSAGLMQALSGSEASEGGTLVAGRYQGLTPTLQATAIRLLLARPEWTRALLAAVEAGAMPWQDLALDERQRLASHPDDKIAALAKQLLSRDGGLPNPDRQKVIDELAEVVLSGGDATRGKLVFEQQCGKCHMHSGEGKKIGPDLTGMAAHPRQELLVHILDPSRSVEGNFRQFSVLTTDGRALSGLLMSESKTALELVDVEGKTQQVLREDVEQLVASPKSLMPEGFEKQVPTESLTDLLAFLTRHGRYTPLDLRKAATSVSTRGMFISHDSEVERLIFEDWSPKNVAGVPFHLIDPQGERVRNVIVLHGPQGNISPTMPKSVTLPCNLPVKRVHLLSGVSGWGYLAGDPRRTVTMIVRLHYADGETEDHPLLDGEHFADFIRRVDVPGSQFAFQLRGQQLRYLSVAANRDAKVERIELVKGDDATSPVVMAVTVESPE